MYCSSLEAVENIQSPMAHTDINGSKQQITQVCFVLFIVKYCISVKI